MSMVTAGVVILDTHAEAEIAVKELQRSGFDLKKLSIVGRDYRTHEHVVGYYNMGDRMKYWGRLGAFWGGMWTLLFGSAFFCVPGIGPLVVAGPLVGAIVEGLEGSVIVGGLSALGAGLYSIGIPMNSILKYENAVTNERFVLALHGSEDELVQAKDILRNFGHDVQMHTSDKHALFVKNHRHMDDAGPQMI